MSSKNSSRQKRISKSAVAAAVDRGVLGADTQRQRGLGGLNRLLSAKSVAQTREQKRLLAKHGADNPRSQVLAEATVNRSQLLGALSMESTRAATEPLAVADSAWGIQGYVYDRNGLPVAAAKVRLVSLDTCETLAETSASDRGHYQIHLGESASDAAPVDESSSDADSDRETGDGLVVEAPSGLRINTGADAAGSTGTAETMRLSNGLRVNRGDGDSPVRQLVVRASVGDDPDTCADSSPVTPLKGRASYRDLILDVDVQAPRCKGFRSRYLGNANSCELHDLERVTPSCQIDRIKLKNRIYFRSEEEALAMGFDYCAYCYGRELSKR